MVRHAKPKKDEIAPPTDAQLARDEFELVGIQKRGQTVGRVYSRVRQLEALSRRGFFTDDETKALWQYRYNADMADRSLIRDSLNKTVRGGNDSDGIPAYVLDAKDYVAKCEREAGRLAIVLRSIIVDDKSPSQYAMETGGAAEYCYEKDGKRICELKPKRRILDDVQHELKIAARRIAAITVSAP